MQSKFLTSLSSSAPQQQQQYHIQIPINTTNGQQKFIQASPDQICQKTDVILTLLTTNQAPLKVWAEIAIAAEKNNSNHQAFLNIMKKGIQFYKQFPVNQLTQIQRQQLFHSYNSLAGYYFGLARFKPQGDTKNNFTFEAAGFVHQADSISKDESVTLLTKAFVLLFSNHFIQAKNYFQDILQRQNGNLMANLGLALLAATKGEYSVALQHLKKILIFNPQCPSSIRTAMGICYYKLQEHDIALMCFQRAIQLNPSEQSSARVGKALIYLHFLSRNAQSGNGIYEEDAGTNDTFENTNFSSINLSSRSMQATVNQAYNQLVRAFEIDKYNLSALYLITKIYFLQGKYDLVLSFSQHGLSLLNYLNTNLLIQMQKSGQAIEQDSQQYYLTVPQYQGLFAMKAQFNFYLGMVYHHRSNVDKAMRCYKTALQINPSHQCALLNYGRLLLAGRQIKKALVCLKAIEETKSKLSQGAMFLRIIAEAYQKIKYSESAYKYYKRLITLQEEVKWRKRKQQQCVLQQQQQQQQLIIQQIKNEIEIKQQFAKICEDLGNFTQAISTYRSAISTLEKMSKLVVSKPLLSFDQLHSNY